MDEPKRVTPNTESEEPKRAKPLRDSEAPMWM
jgi:hypothetical protein